MSEERSDAEVLDIMNGLRARRARLAAKYGVTDSDAEIHPNPDDRTLRIAHVLGYLEELITQLAEGHYRACRVRDVCGTCRTIRAALAVMVACDEIDTAEEAVYLQNASQEVPHA